MIRDEISLKFLNFENDFIKLKTVKDAKDWNIRFYRYFRS